MDHQMAPVTHVMEMSQMTFYWGKKVTILFYFWRVQSWGWFAVSLLIVILLAMLHEFLSFVKSRFVLGLKPTEEDGGFRSSHHKGAVQGSFSRRALESLMFGVIVGIRYLLMLASMSFNGGVFIAIVLGLTLGHFLFRSSDIAGSDCA
ncbi:copper transporter 5.1 [Physcomitrium patens]|uniref:Copper transport protein n=2 Tax=Physcomitrium patens TaxID=3218 RepID=A9S7E1_PHYPA|nr:copper transporter 5.1-like [Physcomitrium patens]PNR26356.1 hypothetical protein PHYPA_030931 [Physcomitrium patens]|eukprot:XP_024367311.1 copper transporter 5.1-like [Physcomitrella patens]